MSERRESRGDALKGGGGGTESLLAGASKRSKAKERRQPALVAGLRAQLLASKTPAATSCRPVRTASKASKLVEAEPAATPPPGSLAKGDTSKRGERNPEAAPEPEDEDAMDWEPTESEVLSSLHEMRRGAMLLHEPNGVAVPAAKAKAKADALALHLVVDTNIFLCHLNFVRALADDRRRPLRLHVAWTVLQELDFMKTNGDGAKKRLEVLARKAVKLIYELSQDERVRIQTLDEWRRCAHRLPADNGDDRILQWCLDLQERPWNDPAAAGVDVVLLTNDINLCNKAKACGVRALPKEPFADAFLAGGDRPRAAPPAPRSEDPPVNAGNAARVPVASALQSQGAPLSRTAEVVERVLEDEADFVARLEECLLEPLSKVLEHEMEAAFDALWRQIVLVKPPWSLADVLRCVDKHWIAVFSYVYPAEWRRDADHLRTVLYRAGAAGRRPLDAQSQSQVLDRAAALLRALRDGGGGGRNRFRPEGLPQRLEALERLRPFRPEAVPEVIPEAIPDADPDAVLQLLHRLWQRLDAVCGSPTTADDRQVLERLLTSLDETMAAFVAAPGEAAAARALGRRLAEAARRLDVDVDADADVLGRRLVALVGAGRRRERLRLVENGLHQLRAFGQRLRS